MGHRHTRTGLFDAVLVAILFAAGGSELEARVADFAISPAIVIGQPVTSADGQSTRVVSWTAGPTEETFVDVSRDGGPERLFARGPSGAIDPPWIQPTSAYEFRLYGIGRPRRLLATTHPKSVAQVVTLEADPHPIRFGAENAGSLVTWDTTIEGGGHLEDVETGPPEARLGDFGRVFETHVDNVRLDLRVPAVGTQPADDARPPDGHRR